MGEKLPYIIFGMGIGAMLYVMLFSEPILFGLAKKAHKSEKDFDPKELEKGTQIELEHTQKIDVARQIAMDHLTEQPDYYEKLEKYVENK